MAKNRRGERYAEDHCVAVCASCHIDLHIEEQAAGVIPREFGERHYATLGTTVTRRVRDRIDVIAAYLGMSVSRFTRIAAEEKLLREEEKKSQELS